VNVQTNCRLGTASDLVKEALQGAATGDIISVKAAIASVRGNGPHLQDTDSDLTELLVEAATMLGLFVAFDLRE
jgi:hypothetical protein